MLILESRSLTLTILFDHNGNVCDTTEYILNLDICDRNYF